MVTLLTANEVDRIFQYPRGRSRKLAMAGKLPYVELPDGEIRFDPDEIGRAIKRVPAIDGEVALGEVAHA